MVEESETVAAFEAHGYRFVDWMGEDYSGLDFANPDIQQNLTRLAQMLRDIEQRTGARYGSEVIINGEHGYAMETGSRGAELTQLQIGTYGWIGGDVE